MEKDLSCNLQERSTVNHNTKIGFIKFSILRPKKCVLAGASGTHSVSLHQNVKWGVSLSS